MMLRNDLITLLAQYDNDTVTVPVNGSEVEVEGVTLVKGLIAIVLNGDGLRAAVSARAIAGTTRTDSP